MADASRRNGRMEWFPENYTMTEAVLAWSIVLISSLLIVNVIIWGIL
jgi:hypothetical protein